MYGRTTQKQYAPPTSFEVGGIIYCTYRYLIDDQLHLLILQSFCPSDYFYKRLPNSEESQNHMGRNTTNQQSCLYAKRRLRLAWASAPSDQSLRCPHEESSGPFLPIERTAKIWIRLGGCPGWSESSLGAQVISLVLSCLASYNEMSLWMASKSRQGLEQVELSTGVYLLNRLSRCFPRLQLLQKYRNHFDGKLFN